jgi:porphobilinogen synthase
MIKNYFPINRSNSIKKKMLIQPFFVDQKVNDSKKIKGLGDNRSWSSSAVIKAIEKDLKRGINNILLFIVPLQKQKNPEDFSFHYEVIRKIKNILAKI